jgi:hypothetical protein
MASGRVRPTFGEHASRSWPGDDLLPTGFSAGQLFAVRTSGEGLITDTHVVWKVTRGVSNKPSILLVDGLDLHDRGHRDCQLHRC